MKITKITINNFRSIEYAEIIPGTFNVLVGQNNHGKTNFFEAIEWFYNASGDLGQITYMRDGQRDVSVELEYSDIQSGIEAVKNEKTKESFKKFAAAHLIPGLMAELERGPLRRFTPCRFEHPGEQAEALAIVHAKLVLIHPFREGNGRCSRLLATLMALQAGLPALDFGGIRGEGKRHYIAAIHAALGRDYGPMTRVFERVIARTLRSQARLLRGERT